MAKLELLASPPGTGKTTYCIDLFRQEILKSPAGIDSRSYFVLPNREHAGRIQSLVLKQGVPGLFNVHILTIQELGLSLLSGGALPKPSESLRRSILRQILEDHAQALPYFANVKDLPGFYELLSERIQEFKSALLDAQEFERRARKLKDSVFQMKSGNFAALMKYYGAELASRGLSEAEDSLMRLAAGSSRQMAEAQLVILDGFYHFTQAQKKLICVLAPRAARMVVTLTLPDDSPKRPHVFELAEDTRQFLIKLGFSPPRAPRSSALHFLIQNKRVTEPALLHLESSLFLAKPKIFSEKQTVLRLFTAETAHDEVESIAREIRQIHRDTEWHFSDIAVILRGMKGYDKAIERIFGDYGIPMHVHERKKTLESGFGRFVHRFLGLILSDWPSTDLLPLLKSLYGPVAPEEEAVAWLERLAFSKNVLCGQPCWAKLAQEVRCTGAQGSLRWFSEAQDKLLSARSARALRLRFTVILRQCRLDASEADQAALRSIENLLMRVESLYAGGRTGAYSAQGFLAELQRAIEIGLFSQRPRGKNRVQIYDAVMAIPKEYRVVFIAGLLDQAFPKGVTQDPFFKDDERVALNLGARRGESKLELRSSHHAGERYFFYMAVTRARNRLYLSYPKKDRDGRSTLASAFMEEVRRGFSDLPVVAEEANARWHCGSWASERQAERAAAELLFLPTPPNGTKEDKKKILVFSAARKNEPRFRRILEAGWHDGTARFRDARILEALQMRSPVFSATRLESFLTCAFKFYAQHTLRLKPYLEDRLRLEMGTLLHAVLDGFFKKLSAQEKNDAGFWKDRERIGVILSKDLEALFAESPLASEPMYRQRFLLSRMKQTLLLFARRESECAGERDLVPKYFELEFGKLLDGSPAPYPYLEIGKDKILIGGKIDRIDVSRDGDGALVIDYKLGSRNLKNKIEKGLEVQLPVYLLAVKRLLGMDVLGAELHFLESGKRAALDTKTIGELLKQTEERIEDAARRIKKGDIAVRSKSCEFCDYESICRFEKWKLIYSEVDSNG